MPEETPDNYDWKQLNELREIMIRYVQSQLDSELGRKENASDIVQSAITYTLSAEVEDLVLTGTAAVNGFGGSTNNRLTGNSAANRRLSAAPGLAGR